MGQLILDSANCRRFHVREGKEPDAEENKDELAALMITYPSTHGIFETEIKEICDIIIFFSLGTQVIHFYISLFVACTGDSHKSGLYS